MNVDRNRWKKSAEADDQSAPSLDSEPCADLGVIEVDLGYIFADVGYDGTITLIPNTLSDIEIVAPTQ